MVRGRRDGSDPPQVTCAQSHSDLSGSLLTSADPVLNHQLYSDKSRSKAPQEPG